MEQKFKNLNRNIKALKRGALPLSQTFEFDLFKESAWYFAFNELEIQNKRLNQLPIQSPPVAQTNLVNKETEQMSQTKINADLNYGHSVMFVGDNFSAEQESAREDLLGKMIVAMKLNEHEFSRLTLDKHLEDIEDPLSNVKSPNAATLQLWQAILKNKPQYLVSLGATLTNILLGKREKLSVIHGQFIEITISIGSEAHTCHLVPIFHPEFLLINPNMKRTAWIDLQKVMEKLGKN